MSIAVNLSKEVGAAPETDPFRLGWRDVYRERPDGTRELVQIPLTLEDLLHPQPGDVYVESTVHARNRIYLYNVFHAHMAAEPTVLVLTDCKVEWDHPELTHHSPDISVIFNVRRQQVDWSSFKVAEEGTRPTLIIEVVSPDSRVNDVKTKVAHYYRVRVPLYVIVDRLNDRAPLSLIGLERTPSGYQPMSLDAHGRLWLEPLRLWLSVMGDRVICYDGKTGKELGDYAAISQALEAERVRAEKEKRRADKEKRRAEKEKTRADSAEARVRELQAELQRRKKSPKRKKS